MASRVRQAVHTEDPLAVYKSEKSGLLAVVWTTLQQTYPTSGMVSPLFASIVPLRESQSRYESRVTGTPENTDFQYLLRSWLVSKTSCSPEEVMIIIEDDVMIEITEYEQVV